MAERYHPPGTNLGGASQEALSNRIALWNRRKRTERVDFFRVMRGSDHLDDFEAGPESADEIGAFGSLIADSEGTAVTLEIIAMRRERVDGGTDEIAVRSIALRCVPTPPAPAAPPVSEAALSNVMTGYVALQKSSVEMMGGVTAALKTMGELTAQVMRESAVREAAMRAQVDELTELVRESLDEAKAARAAAVPQTRAERLERLIVEMVGRKIEKFAVGMLTPDEADDNQADVDDNQADDAPKVQ